MILSGFLFLFIIITNLASERFGYETFSDLDSDAKLQKINNDPKKFRISFVLILIEHVRHYEQTFNEIYRVLKPNGQHIFTVPINLKRNSFTMVDSSGDKDVYLMPPEYHGDSLRKRSILAYRQFGKDTPKILEKFGFKTKIVVCNDTDAKFGIYDSIVLISKKL